MVHSGSSYCSASELTLTFGLGQQASAAVEVRWPSGAVQKIDNSKSGQNLEITEPRS
jgi:hypothetical protein